MLKTRKERRGPTMQTVYRTNDGREFEDPADCEAYERTDRAIRGLVRGFYFAGMTKEDMVDVFHENREEIMEALR